MPARRFPPFGWINNSKAVGHTTTGGFALSPQTMPQWRTRRKANGIAWGRRTGSEGRWVAVFNRQCDAVSIRPRALVLYGPLVAARNLK
jgi:hypothetical protein